MQQLARSPDSVDTSVRSRRIFLEHCELDGAIGITGGRVVGLYPAGTEPIATRRIDATDQIVLPGLIDSHAHIRDPGFTHKEDWEHGSRAAALGGITTLMDMPNVDPPTNTVERFLAHIDNARGRSVVDFGHNAAGTDPSQIEALADAGATAFKIFMMRDIGRDYPHMPGTMVDDTGRLYEIFAEVARTGRVLMVHPHDQDLWEATVRQTWEAGDRGPQAYARAWFRDEGLIFDLGAAVALQLQAATGVSLHLLHTTTARTIAMANAAKAEGSDVTLELNPHCLFLGGNWDNIERLGPYSLGVWVSDAQVRALWEGARSGALDIAGTDHAPHSRDEKEIGWTDMFVAPGGSPSLQEYLSLFLTSVNEGLISLRRVVDLCATKPARRFGLYPRKGVIRVGADADLVVVDLDREDTITGDRVASKCGWTPYEGRRIRGVPVITMLRGRVIAEEGQVVADPGYGQFLGDQARSIDNEKGEGA